MKSQKDSKETIKVIATCFVILLIFGFSLQLFYKKFERPPEDLQRILGSVEQVMQSHHQLIKKIQLSENEQERNETVEEYLNASVLWLDDLTGSLAWLRERRHGYTMRLKSQMATHAFQVRQEISVIKETRLMFENALNGFVDPEHKLLLDFDPKGAYDRLFPALKKR